MSDVEQLAIDAVRVLSMDAVQKANSGHPGTPMALAPVGYVLFHRHLRHNPTDPDWIDRDRFVLSVGHASMLIYSLLHLSGYELSAQDIENFRQWGSPTAGHPEYGHVPGVETTTGPLGQGVANSVGMALTERWLATRFNRPGHEIVDHFTYALCSDGDVMEGVSHEAAAIAGHQKLGKLMWIWDDNKITIEGGTDLSMSTDHAKRFESYGWHVVHVHDGNDLEAIDLAITEAKNETERPSLVVLRTVIAYGSPGKAGTSASHGAALGEDEVKATKENLGYPSLEPFHVDDGAKAHWRTCVDKGERIQDTWNARFSAYAAEFPALAAEYLGAIAGELPTGWDDEVPDLSNVEKGDATRGWSGKVIQGVAAGLPNLIGGSADLGGSNKTDIAGAESLLPETPGGRVVHYGVREHAMGSIMNGMVLHGGVRPYAGTFLIFSDYMRPAIRLAGLMGLPVVYVFSHDSIGLGEDGPTHQPVEQLPALRAIPNVCDLRPGDAAETEVAWRVAVERTDGPSWLALSRQKVAVYDRSQVASAEGLRRGAYVFQDASNGTPVAIVMASGSELELAVAARDRLEAEGIPTRVVSFPSWHLFQQQDSEYRDSVLPSSIKNRVSIEAASTFGWSRWTGDAGHSVGIDHFGASAPAEVLYEKFGVTVDAVVEAVKAAR
ncbi:MAG: transketolase [Gemmatimonadales bacterium]|nr:transketolase [Gemmatimonadales bacterium]MBT4912182.1 transketolase [Gemmatimonadales bacterium]MBT6374350.1 transketolase [Gemmatimonadales bacterium]